MPLVIPKIRDDLEYSQDSEDSDYWFVKCPIRNDFFRFNQIQRTLMLSLDGTRSVDDLIDIVGDEWEVEMAPTDVERFLDRLLERLLLDISSYQADDEATNKEIRRRLDKAGFGFRPPERATDSVESQLFAQGMNQALSENPLAAASYFRAVLEVNPENERARQVLQCILEAFLHVRRSDMPFGARVLPMFNPEKLLGVIDRRFGSFIYSWFGVILIAALSLACIPLTISLVKSPDFDLSTFDVYDVIALILAPNVWLFIHELGHALSCYHYGGRPREVGYMLMFGFLPAAYCDTSDTYTFKNRRHKVICFLSGIPAQMMAMMVMLVFCSLLSPSVPGWHGLVVGTLLGVTIVFENLIPFVPFDGYFALGDYVKILNLRDRSFAYVWATLGRVIFGVNSDLEKDSSDREKRILLIFGLLAMGYTLAYLVGLMINWLLPLLVEYLGLVGFLIMLRFLYGQVKHAILSLVLPFLRFLYRERATVFSIPRTVGYACGISGIVYVLAIRGHTHLDGNVVIEPSAIESAMIREPGLVSELHVQEGQSIEAGTLLASLSSQELELDLARAVHAAARAEVRLSMLESGARQEEIKLALAKQDGKRVSRSVMAKRLENAEMGLELGVSSGIDVSSAKQELISAQNAGSLSKVEVEMLKAGARLAEIEEAQAEIAKLQAEVDALEERMSHLEIRSTIAGRIVTRDLDMLKGRWMRAAESLCQIHSGSWRVTVEPGYGEVISGATEGRALRVRINGYPNEELNLVVDKVLPPKMNSKTSSAIFQSNEFQGDQWRMGMTGHGRIYGPKRSLAFRYVLLPLKQVFDIKILKLFYDT